MPRRISVIGSGTCSPATAAVAEELGCRIAEAGFELVCGGLGGVMEAACRGAALAGGRTIGILPGADLREANPFVQIPIATGLGQMRNFLVVANGDIAVAVEGGAGTLSEIGLALKTGRNVVAVGALAAVPGVVPAENAVLAMEKIQGLLEE